MSRRNFITILRKSGYYYMVLKGLLLFVLMVYRLIDVKQGQNKEGKTVLYLVFEYMDTDLKKYIRTFRNTGDNVPSHIVKVLAHTN